MKITINGKVSEQALKTILDEQVVKIKTIDTFCKENKLQTLYYKDTELEYEHLRQQSKKQEVEKR